MKKQKEPKEKKPKKQKVPKEKKSKKGQPPAEGQEGKGGKKGKKKLILLLIPLVLVAAAAIVIFVILPGRGGDDPEAEVSAEPVPPSLPPEYQVGDETVAGMTLGADESEAKAVPAKTVVYTYVDLADAGKAAETYVSQLSAADPRFYVVDEEFVRTDRPDFTAREGTVLMARNIVIEKPESSPAPEESAEGGEDQNAENSAQPTPTPEPTAQPEEEPGRVLTVKIEWSEGQCVVTADEAEGKVTTRPRTPQGSVGGGGMGQQAAKDYLKSLNPAQLGLSGQSMENYEILVNDGTVFVNDLPCHRINIYDEYDVIMGCFLIALDGQHMYRLDVETNQVTAMDMPQAK